MGGKSVPPVFWAALVKLLWEYRQPRCLGPSSAVKAHQLCKLCCNSARFPVPEGARGCCPANKESCAESVKKSVCCVRQSCRHYSKPASSLIFGRRLWSAFNRNLLPRFQTSDHCAGAEKVSPTFTGSTEQFYNQTGLCKNKLEFADWDRCTQPHINLQHAWTHSKASPMKSSYTAAIIKMIFYLQGLKAILNHEPASEQGTPSLWDKCMKWKYSQGLRWISIYSMSNPALQFSA